MRKFSLLAVFVLLFSVTSCVLGLGDLVDIEAPEIHIDKMVCEYIEDGETKESEQTIFSSTIYTKKKVRFYGRAFDNIAVTKVYAEVKDLNDSDYTYYKDATIEGENWYLDFEFKDEGACWVKFIVEDKKKNVGNNYSKVVSLFVDETAPVGTGWYIDRLINGIQYNLQSQEKLKNILDEDKNLLDPQNKDVAQNGEFLICSSFNDAAGIFTDENNNIPTTTISIYDVNGVKIAGPISAESGSGNYSPKFKINDTVIKNYPDDEFTLLQVRYSSKDIVTVPKPNEIIDKEIELGWFIWCPDSDKPRCSVTGYEKDAPINIYVGDSLNITVFDDDGLKGDISCTKNGIEIFTPMKTASNGEREKNIIIPTPETPEKFELTIKAHDINTEDENQFIYTKTINVIDKFNPTLILTNPENNQIPEVSGEDAVITFDGVTLDTSGCKYLEFVWVPDSVKTDYSSKKALAFELLDIINGENSEDSEQPEVIRHDEYAPSTVVEKAAGVKVTSFDNEFAGKFKGVKLWSAKLTKNPGVDAKFIQHNFSFNISLLNDFVCGDNNEKNKEKCFFARVVRDESAKTDSEFKLAADNVVPEIIPINPSGNMAIIDQESPLVIKFKAQKENGLLMDISKYKIEYYPYDSDILTVLPGSYDETEGAYVGATISKETLRKYTENNKNPTVILYAEDLLGNKASATYQAIISALPAINTITSAAPSKCKAGDEILINVSFSKAFTLKDTSNVKLKLTNIENTVNSITTDKIVYAPLKEGNGSTTLVFAYTVQAGDVSDGLQVYNEPGKGPVEGIDTSVAHVETLIDANNLQSKRSANPIAINGIAPKITGVTIVNDGELQNVNGGKTYLRAGKTISATVKTDKAITVQGSPKFIFNSITLDWQSVNSDGNEITFSKKITGETEGSLSYTQDCISGINTIKDDFGNALVSSITAATANIVIDRTKPTAPSITVLDTNKGSDGKFNNSAKFTVTAGNDANLAKTEYSIDGGRNWNLYSSTVTVTTTSSLVARCTDYAGNVSDYSEPVDVAINSTFPSFQVECTNSDGRYKAGTVLEFKVYFANSVDIPLTSEAYINLSANTGSIKAGSKAVITSGSKGTDKTDATFTYTVSDGDDFTLKIAKDGVNLLGIKDKYGVAWSSSSKLENDYIRSALRCDAVVPTIVSMIPAGDKTTQNGLNAYSNAKQIKLTFSEPVSVVSGNIYLRQTAGWAIPPMFTAEEFNKVLSAVSAVTVEESGKTLTGSQVLYMDGEEDAENLYSSLVGAANDRYHGTAQYVGPYKKMTNGINDDGTPNLDVKYVLDFGVDIWDSEKSTKKNFGKTFEPNWSPDGTKYTYENYHKIYQSNWVHVITPETVITTDTIRSVLEKAHFHERYMAVNSSYVKKDETDISGTTYILNFPEGILGELDLPLGREWELVIEKNSFMDETGNYFGSSSETEFVLVKNENNNSFMSSGVAAPVIRVDRYSYGLGINQPESVSNNSVTYERIMPTGNTSNVETGTTTPRAKVAVKIDCESKDASVRYSINEATRDASSTLTLNRAVTKDGVTVRSYASQTTVEIPSTAETDTELPMVVFLAGSGNYKQSYKAYITADSYSGSEVSKTFAKEGIFQTVVDFNNPTLSGGNEIASKAAGKNIVNIHGTTGTGGVPSISPYPLRDQPVASAYMRQCFKDTTQNSKQYFWVSYEILADGIFSMYAYGKCAANQIYGNTNTEGRGVYAWSDWSPGYGKMEVGEFIRCDNMESYTQNY